MQRLSIWVVVVAAIVATALGAFDRDPGETRGAGFVVFSASQRGCAIVIPADALPQEREAAELLRDTLAKSAGIASARFPIMPERGAAPRRALFVGATRRGKGFASPPRRPPFDTAVGVNVLGGGAFLRSEKREAIVAAAGWFLEMELGAHWFMPGPLGEHIPRRSELILPPGEKTARPGFISRDIGTGPGADERAWHARNRLEARFEHGHNFAHIFRPEDLRSTPEMAPLRNGARYIPAPQGDESWQPNLLSPAAVEHAATAAIRAFDADPQRISFSLSENDGFRFDDSAETLAAVAPPRFFRHRPDYSNLVFRFTNAVAERVARHHPDRWLPAYAYYWCENTPDFPVAPNVVPFLTADRNQWSKPEFAAEDRALIERWCRSGAKIVGIYDYLEGAHYFCPRPMLASLRETIPFAYRTGVRAFYGEGQANWALDGPKQWLAAQLLWSPRRSADELLETYFREFWAEAAEPMREFFARCERTWREEPSPPLWLRYYEDEDQSLIFSAEELAALRRWLTEAAAKAQSPLIRARVAFSSAGFRVTEAFSDFCSARRHFSRLALPGANPAELVAAWQSYRDARSRFVATYTDTRREQPLAIAPPLEMQLYLRNQPDSRAARELSRTAAGRALLADAADLTRDSLGAMPADISVITQSGREWLVDAEWRQLAIQPVGASNQLDWLRPNQPWQGYGEPWETRRIEFDPARRVLRIAGARTEQVQQWIEATPGALYTAQANVRAKVSPGTATFLLVSFLDEQNRHIGQACVDRVPAASETQELQLCVIARAPANARRIGFALRVLNQINDDFAEFSHVSLRAQ